MGYGLFVMGYLLCWGLNIRLRASPLRRDTGRRAGPAQSSALRRAGGGRWEVGGPTMPEGFEQEGAEVEELLTLNS